MGEARWHLPPVTAAVLAVGVGWAAVDAGRRAAAVAVSADGRGATPEAVRAIDRHRAYLTGLAVGAAASSAAAAAAALWSRRGPVRTPRPAPPLALPAPLPVRRRSPAWQELSALLGGGRRSEDGEVSSEPDGYVGVDAADRSRHKS